MNLRLATVDGERSPEEVAMILGFSPTPELQETLTQADELNDHLQDLSATGQLYNLPQSGKVLFEHAISKQAKDVIAQADTIVRGFCFVQSSTNQYQTDPARLLENRIFERWSSGPEKDIRTQKPGSERLVKYLAEAIRDPFGLALQASLDSQWDEGKKCEVLLYEPAESQFGRDLGIKKFLTKTFPSLLGSKAVPTPLDRPDLLLVFSSIPNAASEVEEALKTSHDFRDFIVGAFNFFLVNHQTSSIDLGQVLCCNPALIPAWEYYLRHHLKQSHQPSVLLELCQKFWRHNSPGWEALAKTILPEAANPLTGPVEEVSDYVEDAATPIETVQGVEFGPSIEGTFTIERGCIHLEMGDWPEGMYLHLIVRGKNQAMQAQTTKCSVLSSPEDLATSIIEEPAEGLVPEISGFFCDKQTEFKTQKAWAGINSSHWCRLNTPTPYLDTVNERGDTLAFMLMEIAPDQSAQRKFIHQCFRDLAYDEEAQVVKVTLANLEPFLASQNAFEDSTCALIVRRWEGVTLYLNTNKKTCHRQDDTVRPKPTSRDLYEGLETLFSKHWASTAWPLITQNRTAERRSAGIEKFWKSRGDISQQFQADLDLFKSYDTSQWQDLGAGDKNSVYPFFWEQIWKRIESQYPEITTLKRQLQQKGILIKIEPNGVIRFAFNIKGIGIHGGETDPGGTIHAQASYAAGTAGISVQLVDRPRPASRKVEEVVDPLWIRETQQLGEKIFAAVVAPIARDKRSRMSIQNSEDARLADWQERAKIFSQEPSPKKRKEMAQVHPVYELLQKHLDQQNAPKTEEHGVRFRVAYFEAVDPDDEEDESPQRLVGFRTVGSLDKIEEGECLVMQDFKINFAHTEGFKKPDVKLTKPFTREKLTARDVEAKKPVKHAPPDTEDLQRHLRRQENYESMGPLMTERNLQYLILRVRSTFYKALPRKDKDTLKYDLNGDIIEKRAAKCASWTAKNPIKSEAALRIINRVLEIAGISVNQLCDPEIPTGDLFNQIKINGAPWVEYLLECLMAENIPMGYQQAFTITKPDLQEMVDHLNKPKPEA